MTITCHEFGLMGVAYANIAGEFLNLVLTQLVLKKLLGFRLPWIAALQAFLLSLGSVGLSLWLVDIGVITTIISVSIYALLGCLVGLCSVKDLQSLLKAKINKS